MLKSAHPDELFCLLGFIIWFSGSVMQLQMGFSWPTDPQEQQDVIWGAIDVQHVVHQKPTHTTLHCYLWTGCVRYCCNCHMNKCYQIFGSALNYHYYYYHDIFLPVVTSYQTWNQAEPCRHTLLSPLSPPWEKSVTSPLCVRTSKFS